MAIGSRSRRRGSKSGSGAPRSPRREVVAPARGVRLKWMVAGALALALPLSAVSIVRASMEADDSDRVAAARADVATTITRRVDAALEPLGQLPAPQLLSVPAGLADALEAARDDASVVRAATIGESSIPLLEDARAALSAVDVPTTVRDRGLSEGFVVTLIDARARMLDGLDLYISAAQLAAEAALLEGSSLEAVLATARSLADQATALFAEGHDLLVEAQIAAGTYSGPMVPAGGLG